MQTQPMKQVHARRRSAPKPPAKSSDTVAWPPREGWLYPQALTLVRRQGVINAAELAMLLGVAPGSARALIVRMQDEGLLGEPDMFGECRVVVQEGGSHE